METSKKNVQVTVIKKARLVAFIIPESSMTNANPHTTLEPVYEVLESTQETAQVDVAKQKEL